MLALVNILEGRVEEVNMEPWNILECFEILDLKLICRNPINFVGRVFSVA